MTTYTILSWIGSGLQILGAASLAGRFLTPRASYAVMFPGSLLWLSLSIHTNDWALAAMQASFTIINAVGLIAWRTS
ncbi:MAG: hypothetical protein KGO02_24585 [Alphaproteobacteria bacterium]|nr:hypothetical protein [Alphaproteobacteria bacterium]